jgi:hypothetical protein
VGAEIIRKVGLCKMSELAIVSCVISTALLCAAALDAGSREAAHLDARRAAMQAEIDHACRQPD